MRMFILLLLLFSIAGCAGPRAADSSSRGNAFRPATDHELVYAEQHISLLQTDMTNDELFAVLGLSRFRKEATLSGGPRNHLWTYYTLRRNPALNLIVYRDYTASSGTGKLLSVSIGPAGASWKATH
jgi:hypothetical protein